MRSAVGWIATLLVLGATVNVAVAWGCVWLLGHDIEVTSVNDVEWGEERIRDSFESLPFRDRFIDVHFASVRLRLEESRRGIRYRAAWFWVYDKVCREKFEHWERWRVGTLHPPGPHRLAYQQYDAGFPFAALTGETWRVRHIVGRDLEWIYWTQTPEAAALAELVGHEVAIHAIAIPKQGQDPTSILVSQYWGFTLIPLPLRPLPLGFVLNTLLYAGIIWLLFATPFTARRILRRRRGLCEKCAYPIGVSPVCTECGAAVDRSARGGRSGTMIRALRA